MAVPKRRTSKARTRKRRANWKISAVATHICSHCREPKMPHRACPNCGTYRGREVLRVEAN